VICIFETDITGLARNRYLLYEVKFGIRFGSFLFSFLFFRHPLISHRLLNVAISSFKYEMIDSMRILMILTRIKTSYDVKRS